MNLVSIRRPKTPSLPQLPWSGASMELLQKMEVEAGMNLETEIDASDADDVKLCIRMQTPKFITKVKMWNRQVHPG